MKAEHFVQASSIEGHTKSNEFLAALLMGRATLAKTACAVLALVIKYRYRKNPSICLFQSIRSRRHH